MQAPAPILLMTADERLVQAARLQLYAQSALDVIVARTFAEGLELLLDGRPCAVIAHAALDLSDDQISQLLWAASRLPRVVPVVVVGDQYDEERARTLFQLGVADYLGRDEHLARLAALLTTIVPRSPAIAETAAKPAPRAALPGNPRLTSSAGVASNALLPGLQRFPILGEG